MKLTLRKRSIIGKEALERFQCRSSSIKLTKNTLARFYTLISFIWKVVKGAGHQESEIMDELDRIANGGSWVGFDDLPKKFSSHVNNI